MPEIATILGNETKDGRVISFSRFMEVALYCPEMGYYERAEVSPGRTGDFFTSVSVGPVFGRLLAARMGGWLEELAGTEGGRLQVVEAGAHGGQLARDILAAWAADPPSVWDRVEYVLVEPSARRRAWQAEMLQPYAGRVRWVESPEALGTGAVDGVIFSNELVDAFPVTRLRWSAERGCWVELGVTWAGGDGGEGGGNEGVAESGRFVWAEHPASDGGAAVRGWLAEAGLEIPEALARVLPDGFMLDLTTGAGGWWRAAAGALRRGRLLTFDYGLTAERLLSPERREGTLRAYRDHRLERDVLALPGGQDLTSHVNFTQLIRAGEAAGLKTETLETQGRFLTRVATECWAGMEGEEESTGGGGVPTPGRWRPGPAELRQFQTLVHPEHLGARFQVLVQSR